MSAGAFLILHRIHGRVYLGRWNNIKEITMEFFIALPDEVKVGLTAVVLWVVSFFLAKLIALVPFLKFLEEFREPLAFAIAAALIGAIEAAVPDAYAQILVVGLQLILAILAFFGIGTALKKSGVKAFR